MSSNKATSSPTNDTQTQAEASVDLAISERDDAGVRAALDSIEAGQAQSLDQVTLRLDATQKAIVASRKAG